jgi:hypothetical protein
VKRFSLVLALLAAGALTAPAGAGAIIQIDQGIGGARIGNTGAQVRAALGRPDHARRGRNAFGRFVTFTYSHERMRITFQGGRRVSLVSTSGLGDRVASGVGVGSTEREVSEGVPGVKCEDTAGVRSCHTNEFRAGQRVTDFIIRRGKVARVNVGIVID